MPTTEEIAATEQKLRAVMKDAGMRQTLARGVICRVLAESDDSFITAASVLERVAATVGHVDKSTVYRTLKQLENLGYLHFLPINGQPGAWHLTLSRDHQHLVCDSCGASQSMPAEEIKPLVDHIQEKYGFSLSVHHFAFVGRCSQCPPDVPPGS